LIQILSFFDLINYKRAKPNSIQHMADVRQQATTNCQNKGMILIQKLNWALKSCFFSELRYAFVICEARGLSLSGL